MFLPAHNAENLPSVIEDAVTHSTGRGTPYQVVQGAARHPPAGCSSGYWRECYRMSLTARPCSLTLQATRRRMQCGYEGHKAAEEHRP